MDLKQKIFTSCTHPFLRSPAHDGVQEPIDLPGVGLEDCHPDELYCDFLQDQDLL